MKILLVDDEPLMLEVVKSAVRSLGHEPLAAADGEAGWSEFLRHKPRIVISDWSMPETSGLELCRRIRRAYEAEYTYFILLTSNAANQENHAGAMEAGVDDFLTKPAAAHELAGRLRVADRILGLTQRVTSLERLIPICAYCKDIRRPDGEYERVEDFINRRTPTDFTHGICPICLAKARSVV